MYKAMLFLLLCKGGHVHVLWCMLVYVRYVKWRNQAYDVRYRKDENGKDGENKQMERESG